MTAKLFSKTGALAGTEYFIEKEALIGRDTHCDITLYLHTISSRHARIFLDQEKGVFFLEDMESSNGTFVDKTRVTSPVGLGKLHVITFAKDVDMIFQLLPEGADVKKTPEKTTHEKAPTSEPKKQQGGQHTEFQEAFVMPAGILPDEGVEDPGNKTTYGQTFDSLPELPSHDDTVITDPGPENKKPPVPEEEIVVEDMSALRAEPEIPEYTLVINTVKETGRRVSIKPGKNVIGRSEGCEVSIQDEYLSGRHALLRVTAEGVFLSDLESRNGTFIGDEAVKEEKMLEKGVIFRLGPTTKLMLE